MRETVLMFQFDAKTQSIIETILKQLDVQIKELVLEDTTQYIGYLLNLDGYEKQDGIPGRPFKKPFLFFAHFSEDQIYLVLDVFKQAGVPFIPYKALLTNDNVDYTFEQLYTNVENEYLSMRQPSGSQE